MKRDHTSKGPGRRSSPRPPIPALADAREPQPTSRPASAKVPSIVVSDDLAPNDTHPLAGITAECRVAERVRTVAVVLAKLARRRQGSNKFEDKEGR